MAATTCRTLQDTLEADYPLLDTSLLAALISDLPSTTSSSDDSISSLRQMLSQLSVEAEAQQQRAESDARAAHNYRENGENAVDFSASSVRLESECVRGSEKSGSSPDDLSLSGSGANSSISSATSTASTTSPLEFLRILFPHLSDTVIQKALREHSNLDDDSIHLVDLAPDDTDMSAVVDDLLTLEYIQDLTERGLEAISDTESDSNVWQMATARGKHAPSRPRPPKCSHTHTIPLVDIRQRQHVLRKSVNNAATLSSRSFSGDPWTRLTSLSTQLSELLKPTPPGFFMSYFHAPKTSAPTAKTGWKAEGDALRSALLDIVARSPSLINETELQGSIDTVRDVVLSPNTDEYIILDAEQRSRLEGDIRLCVSATRGESASALDLVWLLRDLDEAFEQGGGIAHSLSTPVVTDELSSVLGGSSRPQASAWAMKSAPSTIVSKSPVIALPIQPPPIPPPPLSQKHPPFAPSPKKDQGWTLVEPRRPALGKHAHPHAEFIPAYSNRNARTRRPVRGSGNQFGKGGKGDVGELGHSVEWYRERAGNLQSLRNEALREASRHWQGGNAKTRGGEVAFYYAEKARELQEQQKELALGAARVMVQEKRSMSNERDTLDLHGLTITEAYVIVKEAIQAAPPSSSQPLKIITGRGRHSVGQVGVLGPAVRDMLRAEGFHVGKWDGGLIVRGSQ